MGVFLMNNRAGKNVEVVGVGRLFAGLNGVIGSGSNHGAIIGAEFKVREVDLVRFTESTSEGVTKGEIGGDAAGEQDGFGLGVIFDGFFELSDEDFDGGGLEAGGKIVDLLRA